MKRKFLLSLILMIMLGFLITNSVFAEIDPFMNTILTEMDTSKVAVTQDTTITKIVRTVYAILQMVVIGSIIGYLTWHSRHFFSSDTAERSRAKERLPYRILAVVIVLGIDGLITIIAKYFGA